MNGRRTVVLSLTALLSMASADAALEAKPNPKQTKQVTPASTMDPALAQRLWDTLDKASRSGDILARGDAFYGLALIGLEGKEPSAALIDALKDPQGKVRLGASRGLMALGNAAYKDSIVRLLGDPMVSLRDEVLPALASLPLQDQAALIVEGLSGKVVVNKPRLATELVQAGGPLLAETVRQALAKGGDAATLVKQNIATMSGDRALQLFPSLIPVADAELKGLVVAGLGKLPPNTDLGFVKPLLQESDPAVAQKAALVLAARGDHDAVFVLMKVATNEQGPAQLTALRGIAKAATKADLGQLDPFLDPENQLPSTVLAEVYGAYVHADARVLLEPHIRIALQSTDGPLRAAGVKYIGYIEGTQALPRLGEYLTDGNEEVRRNAAWALGELKTGEAVPLLERALRDRSDAVRIEVVRALGKIPDNQVVNVVQFLVSDSNREIKLAAIEALAALRNIDAVDTLRVALSDPDADVRLAALEAIIATDLTQGRAAFNGARGWLQPGDLTGMARRNGKSFAPFLALALQAEQQTLRTEALAALPLIGAEAEAATLGEVITSTQFPDLRMLTLARLATLKADAALPHLLVLATNMEEPVETRVRALEILGGARSKLAEETLVSGLNDPSEQARVAAALGLIKLHRPDA